MTTMTESYVASFTHLQNRPHADRALSLLQRIASLVKPIMRNHGWRLPVLAEFFPDNPSLLGERNTDHLGNDVTDRTRSQCVLVHA